MYDTTPPDASDSGLMRVSEFRRHPPVLGELGEFDAGATKLSALNPSLLQDLLRFDPSATAPMGAAGTAEAGLDLIEVLAAALRHGRALQLHMRLQQHVLPLTVLPASRQLLCPVPLASLPGPRLTGLRVLRVEPAASNAADGATPQPLGPLLWALALRGARTTLLPEIAGVATYRVTPGADFSQLDLAGALAKAVMLLRLDTRLLREIAGWPGFDRERAMRLLNALYLQSALIVSRSHPGAVDGL